MSATTTDIDQQLGPVQKSRIIHKIIDVDSKRFFLCKSYVRNWRLKWRTLATHECRRGQDHGAALVARVDELEEQVAATLNDWKVSDLVNDEERRPAQEPDPFAQLAFAFGLGQNAADVGKACKVDAAAGLHGLDPEDGGEMTLPRAGRPQEVDDLVALDEVELGERQDPVFVERRLEREIEARQRFDGRELSHSERHLHATVLTQGQFLGDQSVDHLERAGFAPLELTHRLIKNLQRPGHLQSDQGLANAVEDRGDDFQGGHGRSP